MRKIWRNAIACGLCVTMLGGCNGGNTQKGTAEKQTSKNAASVSQKAAVDMVKTVREKYAANETVDYADPMYNVEKDHVFTFNNLPEKYFEQDEFDCFAVYYDGDLKNSVNVTIEEDYENKSVTIKPNLTFSIDDEEGSLTNDGTWGSRSKFWLVRNVDLNTGEMLDKPVITVFTTKEEMNTPTVQQSVGEDGWYKLTWSEVEGADYYEVYRYWDAGSGSAFSEITTEGTTVSYNEFKTEAEHEQNYTEKYKDTEIDVTKKYTMNAMLQEDDIFFVVAKTNDGKHSGLSNFCEVKDIANQVPYEVSWDFQTEYEGDHATALPAYVDMEMKDDSVGKFLIEYHGAVVTELSDGRIKVDCKIKNLPIEMRTMYFKGMDYDAFLKEAEDVTGREDELATKSVTADEEIDVPYLPDNDYQTPASDDTTESTPTQEPGNNVGEPTAESGQGDDPAQNVDTDDENISGDNEGDTDNESTSGDNGEDTDDENTSENNETDEEETDNSQNYGELNISEELQNSIYATSAMSEWIAINLLDHQEKIYLGDFPESADSEVVFDATMEAYTQNPLTGMLDSMTYDYETNGLEVVYGMSKEETVKMQEASLSKAKEIVKEIIKDGMSDYEKEEAINEYLCTNGSYNDEIMQYINDDGTIADEADEKFMNSFTPYGILVDNVGVCESYSEAFLLLAKEAGMEAVIVTGRLDGVNHEWNRVKLDDQWYSMDVTNNDCDVLPNGYFNLPDELAETMLKQDNEAFIDDKVSDYASSGMNNEYYTKHEMATDDSSRAVQLLVDKINSEDSAQIRLTGDLNESSVEEIVQEVCDTATVAVKYYYSAGVLSIIKQ